MAGRPATTLNPDLCTICGLNIDYVMQRLNFDEKMNICKDQRR